MQKLNRFIAFVRRQPRWRLVLAAVIVAAAGLLWFRGTRHSAAAASTFTARRGPLDIVVLQGGNLQSLESQEVKCEVRVGYQGTKILKIVEEGYLVTEEDVRNGKVLVELDSSELQKQLIQQEIQYQSAVANLTDSRQNYEIQLNQNQSDVKAAEQKARFARMDFDKFLGDSVTGGIISQIGLDTLLDSIATNHLSQPIDEEQAEQAALAAAMPDSLRGPSFVTAQDTMMLVTAGSGAPSAATPQPAAPSPRFLAPATNPAPGNDEPEPTFRMPSLSVIDFSKYARIEVLGDGEAKQKLRKFEDDLQVSKKELGQATGTIEGTRRLHDKGFVTRTDLQRDEIAFENSRLKVQTAETARDLFLKYEFLKLAEESLSKYSEAVREFDKAHRVAISRLAQARAKLRSAQAQFQVQSRQRKDLQDQIEKCTIPARKSGLVVYGAAGQQMVYYGDQERIREGATVRERQAIITIPDMTAMSVQVKIHESYIKKVKVGQKVRITVDAFPDEILEGLVSKVGVLPDSQNRWMNPDLNVYLTTVTIDGTHNWVKPGMSAKVEILVNRLDDVVYVPVQAVSPHDGKQVCYVMNGSGSEQREVKIGEFNDAFIEVKSGLKEGERVLLRPPDGVGTEPSVERPKSDKPEGDKPSEERAPAAVPAQRASN